MATWRDGPEYAPVERPDAYSSPDVAPLGQTEPTPAEFEAPPERPFDYGAPDAVSPLGSLAAPVANIRDPHEAFDVVSTPLTMLGPSTPPSEPAAAPTPAPKEPWPAPAQGAPPVQAGPTRSAWGSIHVPVAPRPTQAWVPAQPFTLPEPPTATPPTAPPNFPPPALNQPPFPTSGQWYPPPVPNGRRPNPTFGEIVAAVTPGVLIALAVGMLISTLAIPLLIVAHALSSRVSYRRATIHRLFIVVESIIAFLGGFTMYATYGFADPMLWWQSASGWTQLGNFILIIVVTIVVAQGALRGEAKEPK